MDGVVGVADQLFNFLQHKINTKNKFKHKGYKYVRKSGTGKANANTSTPGMPPTANSAERRTPCFPAYSKALSIT